MLFFSQETTKIHKAYSNLFGIDDEDLEAQDEDRRRETDDERSTRENEDTTGFSYKWGWIFNVDRVSETMRISWNEAFKMNIVEFLNILCYIKDKGEWEKKQMEEYKRLHNLK